MNYIQKNCLNCNAEFLTTKGKINSGKGKFCSHKCFMEYRTKTSKSHTLQGKENGTPCWSNYDDRWIVVWHDYQSVQHTTPYASWWWELNVGEIPEGYVIAYLDLDYKNISPSNFECITRRENQKRIHGGYERTDDYKQKMSSMKTGTKMSDEHKRKTSIESLKRWANGVFDRVHKGEHSLRWRGGQSKQYPPEFYEIREFIVERDKNTCQVCGWKITERKKAHVHHCDGNRQHNDQDNLLLLCYLCHGKVHSKSNELPEIMALRSRLEWA
jgi:hypothetical protein